LALAILFLIADCQLLAGVLFAAATIKPQLLVLPLLWLALWTLGDLRRRYRWALAFLIVMVVQIAGAEYYLPHWIPCFWQAIREYRQYTGAISVTEVLIGTVLGTVIEVLSFALLVRVCWKSRLTPASSPAFATTTTLVLALTVLLIPTDSVYNQVLLLPAVLMLLRDWRALWRRGIVVRLLVCAVGLLVAWPWISSVVLVACSFVVSPETIQRAWALPFWTVVPTPLGVAAVMLALASHRTFAESPAGASS